MIVFSVSMVSLLVVAMAMICRVVIFLKEFNRLIHAPQVLHQIKTITVSFVISIYFKLMGSLCRLETITFSVNSSLLSRGVVAVFAPIVFAGMGELLVAEFDWSTQEIKIKSPAIINTI